MDLNLHGPLSEYLLKITSIRVALIALAHACMSPSLLPLGRKIADKNNITGASRLRRDGMHLKVFKHIENGLEPQMLDLAVTPLLIQ